MNLNLKIWRQNSKEEKGKIVDYPIHVNFDDMEISEDVQLSIFHYIKQRLIEKYSSFFKEVDLSKYRKRTTEDLIS